MIIFLKQQFKMKNNYNNKYQLKEIKLKIILIK